MEEDIEIKIITRSRLDFGITKDIPKFHNSRGHVLLRALTIRITLE